MGRIVFGLMVIIFFQPPSYGYAQERRVRVGFSNFGASTSWLWTAKESGVFERNGLRVDLIYVGGTPLLFQALLAGDLDFGDGGGPGLLQANFQARSIVGIAGTVDLTVMKIMAAPEIKSAGNLRGKKIAVTRYGTITDLSARYFLKKSDLSPERDTPIIQVGGITNVLASLQSGATQAGVLSPPYHLQARKLGFNELMDLSKEDIYYPFDYVVATPGFLEKNGATALAFVKGVVEGIHKFKTDKRVAKHVLTKYTKITDESVLEETQEIFARLFQKSPYLTRESLRSIAQLLGETDPRFNAIKLDTLVDDRYVRQLETSGFIQNVYR